MDYMATMGPTKKTDTDRVAANLLKLARLATGLTQRTLAATAGVPQSTVARIESGAMQPTLPLLYRLLAAADVEPRIRLVAYDNHDDVLDSLAQRRPERQAELEHARDTTLNALKKTKSTDPRRRAG
jgi:transcriptional regulator with XRE-family HTH domain